MIHRFQSRLNPYLLLLLALSLPALSPLFSPGYFYDAHDGRHSVFYLLMFDASIQDGALWPRWAMHHIQGYGYPTFLIQAPLGFYIGEIFVLLGAGYTLAAKLSWALGFLGGGWGVYSLIIYWLRQGKERQQNQVIDRSSDVNIHVAAVVAGLLYIYIPYHLVDIYVRAALNDSLLLGWFPWAFLAFDRLIDQGTRPGWQGRLAVAALCLAGTLLTHTFALLSFTPLLITFVLFRLWTTWRDEINEAEPDTFASSSFVQRILMAALTGIAALLLYANFLLPLLVEGPHLEQRAFVTDTYNYERHFVYFGQFFNPFWGYGYSDDPTGANDGMSFQIGVIALFFIFIAIYQFILQHQRSNRNLHWKLTAYFLFITIAILFIMTPAASGIWQTVTPLAIIQFPWRLLALSAFTISVLAGLSLWCLLPEVTVHLSQEANGGFLVFGLLIMFASFSYIHANLQPVEPWREDGRAIFRFEQEHPDMIAFTEWVQEPFTESPMTPNYQDETYAENYSDNGILERLAIISGSGEILSHYSRGSSMGGLVRTDGPTTVRIHVLYFPGWQVRVNGEVVPHRVSNPHGLVEVDLPAGEHRIDARMGSTPVRRLGLAISGITLLLLVGAWIGGSLRKKGENP